MRKIIFLRVLDSMHIIFGFNSVVDRRHLMRLYVRDVQPSARGSGLTVEQTRAMTLNYANFVGGFIRLAIEKSAKEKNTLFIVQTSDFLSRQGFRFVERECNSSSDIRVSGHFRNWIQQYLLLPILILMYDSLAILHETDFLRPCDTLKHFSHSQNNNLTKFKTKS